ncbi:MAG TPA: hypothetical protein VFV60_05475 [bacterium]|nr:hypothetical protein [bacterium]
MIVLLAAIALAVLLLARLPHLRAVLVAAVVSSAAAGLPFAAVPWLPLSSGARILSVGSTVGFAIGAVVLTFALTIVPNLIALGGIRRWLQAQHPPRWWGIAPGPSGETSVWPALTAKVLVIPVGIVYGQLALVATLAMWSFVIILSDRAFTSAHLPRSLILVPEVQVMASVGGITAIGIQAAFDRRASAASRAGTEKR